MVWKIFRRLLSLVWQGMLPKRLIVVMQRKLLKLKLLKLLWRRLWPSCRPRWIVWWKACLIWSKSRMKIRSHRMSRIQSPEKWTLPRSNLMFWWKSNMTWSANKKYSGQLLRRNSCWERCKRRCRNCWQRGRMTLSVNGNLWCRTCRRNRARISTLWIRLRLWWIKLVLHLTNLHQVLPLSPLQSKTWVLISVPREGSTLTFWKESTMKFKIQRKSWTTYVPTRAKRLRI